MLEKIDTRFCTSHASAQKIVLTLIEKGRKYSVKVIGNQTEITVFETKEPVENTFCFLRPNHPTG